MAKRTRKPPTPKPETSSPAAAEPVAPSAGSLVTEKIMALKQATQEYAQRLRDLCPEKSHAALEAKLEHVRANAVLAIEKNS